VRECVKLHSRDEENMVTRRKALNAIILLTFRLVDVLALVFRDPLLEHFALLEGSLHPAAHGIFFLICSAVQTQHVSNQLGQEGQPE